MDRQLSKIIKKSHYKLYHVVPTNVVISYEISPGFRKRYFLRSYVNNISLYIIYYNNNLIIYNITAILILQIIIPIILLLIIITNIFIYNNNLFSVVIQNTSNDQLSDN